MTDKKKRNALLVLSLISLIVLLVAPFIGMETISISSLIHPFKGNMDAEIFWKIRIPRISASFFAGAALAVSGMVFQAMFRNPLATPFTLGVSSGAAFGAAVFIKIGVIFSLFGIFGQSVGAFLGALVSIIIVYALSRLKNGFSTSTMLLAGVAVNFFFSSLILFIQYISDFNRSYQIIRWLMGGFEIAGYSPVIKILPFTIIGSIIVFFYIPELNLLVLGEDIALSRGVDVKRVKSALFFAVSIMVAGVVSVIGPIGFVGMMAPHIVRLFIGDDHRYLSIASFIFGGVFLIFCDTIARTVIAPSEIPVGVITAFLGGPFFIWLLMRGDGDKSLFN
jgi:iron complex transport system permease protein